MEIREENNQEVREQDNQLETAPPEIPSAEPKKSSTARDYLESLVVTVILFLIQER